MTGSSGKHTDPPSAMNSEQGTFIQCFRTNRTIIHIYEQIQGKVKPKQINPFKHTPNKGYMYCHHTRMAAGIARYYYIELHSKILLVFLNRKNQKCIDYTLIL